MSDKNTRINYPGVFLSTFLIFCICSATLLIYKGKAESFLLLNAFHSTWLDTFFIYYTNLGDGLFAVLLSLLLFFVAKKKKAGLTMLIAYAATGIIAQVIKPLMMSPRPKTFFSPQSQPFFINDIIHVGYSSFPSGHTVTAFALATVLVFYLNEKWQQLLFLLLAVFVGFSRIYLSQHFLTDVLGGAIIGVVGAVICMYCFRNIKEEKLAFKRNSKSA